MTTKPPATNRAPRKDGAGRKSTQGSTVVLVGRPNVGKSTLFNRITGTRRAIVTPVPGTTRDVIAQPAEWLGVAFTLVDTGGLFGASLDPLHELVVVHGRRAIESADVLVMVVDGREGLVSGDEEIAQALRAVGVPVIVAVNKSDDKRARSDEFHRLGFTSVVEIAAEHGSGIGDLLDEIGQHLEKGGRAVGSATAGAARRGRRGDDEEGSAASDAGAGRERRRGVARQPEGAPEGTSGAKRRAAGTSPAAITPRDIGDADTDVDADVGETSGADVSAGDAGEAEASSPEASSTPASPTAMAREDAEPAEIGIAIVGRPNVGKSSLVNRLVREERSIVSDLPGTTRDPIDTLLRWHGRDLRIVDTAGIRRAGKVARSAQVEAVSVVLARRAIERADVAVLLIDAVEGPTDQDAAIAGEAERAGCGVIIAANKWDLVKVHGQDFVKTFDDNLRRRLKFLDYAPVLHISAATGERAPKLLEAIERVATARRRRVTTGELNRFLEGVTAANPPVSPGKRRVRIMYASQTAVAPPTFVLFTNVATTFHFSYERFLTNRLRDAFGFEGSPIRLHIRRRREKGERD